MTILLSIALVCALQALVLGLVNMRRYRRADPAPAASATADDLVTVCIPARNEEANIEGCVRSALASTGVEVEVLCYDDQSTDATPAILARLQAEDRRVRTAQTVPLPEGWNGKQHGCHRMAEAARGRWLLFTDADVRFAPECVARTLATARRSDVALLSTVPKQTTGTIAEATIIPLIHFMLLSYLPIGRMRSTLDPASSAGCGQFLFVRSDAYRAAGGHAAFKASMHDGIKMPRALRAAGFRTDLFDGTDLVVCRMYRGFLQCWRGFAKNAFEGLGSVALLVFVTVLHAVGHLLPWAFLGFAAATGDASRTEVLLALAAIAAALLQRLVFAVRFEQSILGALLHPVGVAIMTAVQWYSLYLARTGRRSWKGRVAGSGPGAVASPSPTA
jgi:glycosyltransferase involved in cell wall biosynthesis